MNELDENLLSFLQQTLDDVLSRLDGLEQSSNNSVESASQAGSQQSSLARQLNSLNQSLKDIEESLVNVGTDYQDLKDENALMKKALAQHENQLSQLTKILTALQK